MTILRRLAELRQRAEDKICALILRFSGSVFYIGGSDVLPAPLSQEEEERMLREYAEGSQEARSILIEHNLRGHTTEVHTTPGIEQDRVCHR